MGHGIADTGVTVGYEPSEAEPVVDIVFVHGLQGHPYRTWAATNIRSSSATRSRPLPNFRGVFSRFVTRPLHAEEQSSDGDPALGNQIKQRSRLQPRPVFWPVEFMPEECPNSRVLLYGYDTKVTKLIAGAPDRGSTLSHGKDLLFALDRTRTPGCPLIFVAHSLGGIIVKEVGLANQPTWGRSLADCKGLQMLSSSEAAGEPRLKDIVKSTAAVMFLGTPHRGSPELVDVAEWARLVVHSLRFESSWAIMDVLGLKNRDLERTQEAFSRLWQTYNFQVKTFQEGMGLTGFKLGNIGSKVVPDHSSLIGDWRERAETIRANHRDMCRFARRDDPNYRRVVGELRSVYLSVQEPGPPATSPRVAAHRDESALPGETSACGSTPNSWNAEGLSERQRACLRALYFPNMGARYQEVDNPAEGTCRWLFERCEPQEPGDLKFKSPEFRNWVIGDLPHTHKGLLWIKGKPGSGKSVLMKEAYRRISAGETNSLFPPETRDSLKSYCTAVFFFNAKGDELARSSVGLFRSLLYQLLPHHSEYFQAISTMWAARLRDWEQGKTPMQEAELRNSLRHMFTYKSAKPTYIFIDALDECDNGRALRSLSSFWKATTRMAINYDVNLNVCLSSRNFPTFNIIGCPKIPLDDYNGPDIGSYVEMKINEGLPPAYGGRLITSIEAKCCGIFLWAALVVDDVLKMWDEGRNIEYILKHLNKLPRQLDDLFSNILASLSEEESELATRLFHWAILTTKPLRLREWHHIMAFIKRPAPYSLRQWRLSDEFTEDDDQLIKQIRYVSKGLVEVRSRMDGTGNDALDSTSLRAAAGSLSLESGETRVVQVIHESVREFFLESTGMGSSFEGPGHISIMMTCLDYMDIPELDSLVHARIEAYREAWSTSGIESDSQPVATDVALDSKPLVESFKGMGEMTRHSDITEWLKTIQGPAVQPHQTSPSSTSSSTNEQTHVLEDYPALLSYATCELFSHAQLAEKCGADPIPIVRQMWQPRVWDRWVALREDIPLGTKPIHYFSQHGLHSWVHQVGGDVGAEDWRVDLGEVRGRSHRGGSIASFESASSHTRSTVSRSSRSQKVSFSR